MKTSTRSNTRKPCQHHTDRLQRSLFESTSTPSLTSADVSNGSVRISSGDAPAEARPTSSGQQKTHGRDQTSRAHDLTRSGTNSQKPSRGSPLRPQQLQLIKKKPVFFGGKLLHGRRRGERPLSSRNAIHLVMRSSWAMGAYSMLRRQNYAVIDRELRRAAKKYGVRIYQRAIASNHIHLVLRITNRKLYTSFIRVASGRIAVHVMREKSYLEFMRKLRDEAGDGAAATERLWVEPQGKGQKFWQFRPFTRVVRWGRDYRSCCRYVLRNTLEAFGFVEYRPRQTRDQYAVWMRRAMGQTKGPTVGPQRSSADGFRI